MIEHPHRPPVAPRRPPAGRRPRVRARAAERPVAAALLTLLLACLLTLWAAPSPAAAHAVLLGVDPADDTAVEAPPEQVTLRFNEAVSTPQGGVRVFDATGERVDAGPADTGDPTEVAVALPDDLPAGAYVVAYRVISADSHPVTGTSTFLVGTGETLADDEVAAIAGLGSGAVGTVGSVVRGVGYLGVLVATGAVAFALVVARRDGEHRRARGIGVVAGTVAVVATIVHVPLQTAATTGYGLVEVLTSFDALGETLASSFGQSTAVRLVGLAALVWLWARRPRPPLLLAAAAVTLGSYLLDGHQRTIEPWWLLVTGDAVHLAGAATWAGGLLLLALSMRDRRVDDDPVGAAQLVARFSTLALWSVLVLTVAGVAMSLPLVRTPEALWTTTYGLLLLTKVGLVAVAVLIAAYNRAQLVPAVAARVAPAGGAGTSVDAEVAADDRDGRARTAWAQLTRTVTVEVALVAVVALVTGFLVTTQPAAEASGASGPLVIEEPLTDDLVVQFTVDPPRASADVVQLHVYLLDDTGISDAVEDLRLELTYVDQDIGPFVIEPFVAGPGHWTAAIDDLRFAGAWEARIVGGISRFEQAETTLPFEVVP